MGRWVAFDKYRYLDRDKRREVIVGLIVIALICAPVAVIAAYWSKPQPMPNPRDTRDAAPAGEHRSLQRETK